MSSPLLRETSNVESENDIEDAHKYYAENGYVVFRNVISQKKIDDLLKHYADFIVPSKHPFFRQNTNKYEQNILTPHGYVRQSFLDIHDYKKFTEFSRLAKEIFFDQNLQDALSSTTKKATHNLVQSMLFDANAETIPHQDNWYLDSVPNGHLLGAWIALEDIEEKSGRFYVIPKSQRCNFLGEEGKALKISKWIKRISDYTEENRSRIEAPALRKGDVLFWNSATVHGALPTQDPRYSRKSLTAHFLPDGYAFGNLFIKKDFVKYKEYKGMKHYRNQPDYSYYQVMKHLVKKNIYNHPTLMTVARKFQKLFKNV